jgi:nitrogen fixation NifU-like protein
MDHFKNPRNVGEILDADGLGEVGNPVCGDMMSVYIKVKDNVLEEVKFKTFGCGAAIAVSSMITSMAKGKTLDEAMKITNADVAEALGGPPTNCIAPTWGPTPCTPPSRTTGTANPARYRT